MTEIKTAEKHIKDLLRLNMLDDDFIDDEDVFTDECDNFFNEVEGMEDDVSFDDFVIAMKEFTIYHMLVYKAVQKSSKDKYDELLNKYLEEKYEYFKELVEANNSYE